jgi:hypothetical protein
MRSEVSLLHGLVTFIAIWAKLHRSSLCTEMLIVLRSFGDHALKADRSLIDPIMKLKSGCTKIKEYLHVSQYDSLIDTSYMHLEAFTLLMLIGGCPILSWDKTSDQITNTSFLF